MLRDKQLRAHRLSLGTHCLRGSASSFLPRSTSPRLRPLPPNLIRVPGICSGIGASHPVLRRNPRSNTGRLAPYRYKMNGIPLLPRCGYTLVELLVVIAIISILVGLLLPAVMAAREAARVMTCHNNLKQLGHAMHLHEDARKRLPSGGWGYQWPGFADIGGEVGQPGAWPYSLLPFIEQTSLYQLATYQSPVAQRDADLRKRLVSGVPTYNCPSRRSAEPFAVDCASCGSPVGIAGSVTSMSRSDYAANIGDGAPDASQLISWPINFAGPADLAEARLFSLNRKWPQPPRDWSGISYLRVGVRLAEITDGLSSTLMIGEKYLSRSAYQSGVDWGDTCEQDVNGGIASSKNGSPSVLEKYSLLVTGVSFALRPLWN